jgi:ubiquinone/menaquinone biosynthesis C-methylase UbiE
MVAMRESESRLATEFAGDWLRSVQEDFPKFVPFLTQKCGLEFRGRILEIGAGAAWFSAELSKLPNVVEIVTADFSPKLLKEQAPKVFKLLKANPAKITRMSGDFYKFDFPDNYFDFVVCSAVLRHAVNVVHALREVRRVLKRGGQLMAIREPVWPLVKLKSRRQAQAQLAAAVVKGHFYTLTEYEEFFNQAGLSFEFKRVNLSRGFKYYVNKMVNGLTPARYALVGTKRGKNRPGPLEPLTRWTK